MESIVPFRIQIVSIIATLALLAFVARMIVRSKLREEYAIVWIISSIVLTVFAFWRDGLQVMAQILGVYYAPSLVFLAAIFAIVVYLLHLSVVVSRLQGENKILAQEIALLKNERESKK